MKCSETAEIDYPIVLKNEAIGIISIVGLTIKHKEMMLSRKNDYLAFLKGMSELISSKVLEVLASEEMNMIAQKLSHIRIQ
ncbi:hypothetical protein [Thermovenabulum gondwanense]|uniref:GAF domain-containing protein n=1 Tax=Thermovenabulum gondwanense TaxID=520767 RepID=A0A162MQ13_9FIRM|nr:hypothetical protein [Thermovenabulum gondwanense]KYO66916.1 hypothetical protein ATZ99_07330 [Thermovenabulum gondwanense]